MLLFDIRQSPPPTSAADSQEPRRTAVPPAAKLGVFATIPPTTILGGNVGGESRLRRSKASDNRGDSEAAALPMPKALKQRRRQIASRRETVVETLGNCPACRFRRPLGARSDSIAARVAGESWRIFS
jgi:hypothetical protein